MQRPSRRSLLTAIGTATMTAIAGCVNGNNSEDTLPERTTPSQEETTPDADGNSTGGTILPSSVRTGLSYIYPPVKRGTILKMDTEGQDGPNFASMPPSVVHVTEDSTVDRVLQVRGIGSGEDVPRNPSPGTVYVGSIDIAQSDEIEQKRASRGFDRYRIPGNDNRGPIYLANDGEILLAGSKSWVDTTLDEHEAGADTYIESNHNVRELIGHLERVDYHAVVAEGRSLIQKMAGVENEPTTVPSVIAHGGRNRGESTIRIVAMWYASSVGETELEAFPALAESAFGIQNADPETRADGQILFFETTE